MELKVKNKKIIENLNLVKEEIQKEIDTVKDEALFSDIVPLLDKVIKNCESSSKLVNEYCDTKYQREFI